MLEPTASKQSSCHSDATDLPFCQIHQFFHNMEESQNMTTVLQSCSAPRFKRHSLPLHGEKAVCQECSSDIFIQHTVPCSLKAEQNDEE